MDNDQKQVKTIFNILWTDIIESFIELHKQGYIVVNSSYSDDILHMEASNKKLKPGNTEKVIDISSLRKNRTINIEDTVKNELTINIGLGIFSIVETKVQMLTLQSVHGLMSFEEIMKILENGYNLVLESLKLHEADPASIEIFEGFDMVSTTVSRIIIRDYIMQGTVSNNIEETLAELGISMEDVNETGAKIFIDKVFNTDLNKPEPMLRVINSVNTQNKESE
jgi:hypothetical protein